ncbi:MAG: flagellar hook-associated protein FlgK [Pseudomonadota bacterium]
MTISGALSSALSGLRAAGRGAEIVSSNVANALTPGYGRREIQLSSSSIGASGGVRVDGIQRIVDAGVLADRRVAEAEQLNLQSSANFLLRVQELFGTPDTPNALTARLADFENSLIAATSRPDAPERLRASVSEAASLATAINDASRGIQNDRSIADRSIGQQVERLNLALNEVVALNNQITAALVQGGNIAGLQDQRQRVIDEINTLAPVREVQRDRGQVALYSAGGAILVDGGAAEIGFTTTNVVTPYMTLGAGTLGGLTINGTPVRSDSDKGVLRGGSIGAQFEIRDELGVEAQTQLDMIARDLVERFQDPAVDPTLTPGDAGLFTDEGNPFDPVDEVGLSERIQINAAVDPNQGGELWRLRDGMNAVVPGQPGNSTILQALTEVMTDPRPTGSGAFGGAAFTAVDLAATITSNIDVDRSSIEQKLSFAATRLTDLTDRQLADGVDTDAELGKLLVLEQNYAANTRLIQAADEMLQQILRL